MQGQREGSGTMRLRHPFFLLFLALLFAGSLLLSPSVGWERGILVAFDAAAAVFIALTFAGMAGSEPGRLRRLAERNDAGRWLLLLAAAAAVLVTLVLVGVELGADRRADLGQIALIVLTLVIAWLFGNLIFAVHYTHMFYDPVPTGGDHAGLDFPGGDEPDFLDFCYFSFVIGMTFQVSDVEIASRRIRRVATMHALIAFLFNIGVVALTVNVVASAT
jgi:uncharacterized membrane protein